MTPGDDARIDRREFGNTLLRAGWWFLAASGVVSLFGSVRFFLPRAVYSPPTRFLAGRPADYTDGEVSIRFQDDQRVWVVRGEQGIFALSAKCSHLGCRPNWFSEDRRFKCACHGSNFDAEGRVIAGPAPRALRRVAVSLTPDGQILIDRARQAELHNAVHDPDFLIPAAALTRPTV